MSKNYFELGRSINGKGCVRMIRNAKHLYEIKDFVKEHPGESLYMSAYTFQEIDAGTPVYETAIVDRLFLEIDGAGHGLLDNSTWRQIQKFIDWCKEETGEDGGIYPQIFFSGNSGYHVIIIFEKPFLQLQNKETIQYFVKQLGKLSNVNFDMQANNAFSQMRRIPNTKNIKSGYYAIPLTVDEAYNWSPELILETAKKPRRINNTPQPSDYFTKLIPKISEHAKKMKRGEIKDYTTNTINTELYKSMVQGRQSSTTRERVRPCILDLISKDNPNFVESTYIALELIRCGYNLGEMLSVFKSIRGHNYDYQMTNYQLQGLIRKGIFAPSCETLQNKGMCKGDHYSFYREIDRKIKENRLKEVILNDKV